MRLLALSICLFCLLACDGIGKTEEEKAAAEARIFAEAYFNYDFDEAVRHVVSESEPWLRFAASNISQADIDMLNAQDSPATIDVQHLGLTGDTTAYANILVNDFLVMDTLGGGGHWVSESAFTFYLVRRNGKWRIRLDALPSPHEYNF